MTLAGCSIVSEPSPDGTSWPPAPSGPTTSTVPTVSLSFVDISRSCPGSALFSHKGDEELGRRERPVPAPQLAVPVVVPIDESHRGVRHEGDVTDPAGDLGVERPTEPAGLHEL